MLSGLQRRLFAGTLAGFLVGLFCGLGTKAAIDQEAGAATAPSEERTSKAATPTEEEGLKGPYADSPLPKLAPGPPCRGLDLSNRFTEAANGDPLSLLDDPHPLEGVSRVELSERIKKDLPSLGSIAVGAPNRGALVNGVLLPESEHWRLVNEQRGYGTLETITALTTAFGKFYTQHPSAPALKVGDLSESRGGWIRPHRSHQSGQDVDVGYLYSDDSRWYTPATADNLDRALSWSLLCHILHAGRVRFVFVDRGVQALLREHAEAIGEAPELLVQLFDGVPPSKDGVIRHARGHHTHFHVRFATPVAEWTGRQLFKELIGARVIHGRTYYPMPKRRRR